MEDDVITADGRDAAIRERTVFLPSLDAVAMTARSALTGRHVPLDHDPVDVVAPRLSSQVG